LDRSPHRAETRTFLRSRRAKITPEQVGLIPSGEHRVTGPRRGEVAMLAGVKRRALHRTERGNLSEVSERVPDAVTRAPPLAAAACRAADQAQSHST